jgi:hypothetical protein
MQVDFAQILHQLLPPGAFDDLDPMTEELLAVLGEEFARAYTVLLSVTGAVPDTLQNALWRRWQCITGASDPRVALAIRG